MGISFIEDFAFFRNPRFNKLVAGGVTLAFTGTLILGKLHAEHLEPTLYFSQIGNTVTYTLINSSFT
jgi:hypothetical protein